MPLIPIDHMSYEGLPRASLCAPFSAIASDFRSGLCLHYTASKQAIHARSNWPLWRDPNPPEKRRQPISNESKQRRTWAERVFRWNFFSFFLLFACVPEKLPRSFFTFVQWETGVKAKKRIVGESRELLLPRSFRYHVTVPRILCFMYCNVYVMTVPSLGRVVTAYRRLQLDARILLPFSINPSVHTSGVHTLSSISFLLNN